MTNFGLALELVVTPQGTMTSILWDAFVSTGYVSLHWQERLALLLGHFVIRCIVPLSAFAGLTDLQRMSTGTISFVNDSDRYLLCCQAIRLHNCVSCLVSCSA